MLIHRRPNMRTDEKQSTAFKAPPEESSPRGSRRVWGDGRVSNQRARQCRTGAGIPLAFESKCHPPENTKKNTILKYSQQVGLTGTLWKKKRCNSTLTLGSARWQLGKARPDIADSAFPTRPTLTPHGHKPRAHQERATPHQPGPCSLFPGCLSSPALPGASPSQRP